LDSSQNRGYQIADYTTQRNDLMDMLSRQQQQRRKRGAGQALGRLLGAGVGAMGGPMGGAGGGAIRWRLRPAAALYDYENY
jgi:hypothetical protein